MKKKLAIRLLWFIQVCFVSISFSQTDVDTTEAEEAPDEVIINGKHYKAVDEKPSNTAPSITKQTKPLDSSFVIDNNKFQYFNNWMTVGGGVQQNLSYKRPLGFVGAVDVNFHVKKNYFQVGALLSGKNFANYNNYEIKVGFVKRFEDKDNHFAFATGLTYSQGFQTIQIDSVTSTYRSYSQPGWYIQGEVVKKITYDVGIGACLFADWNKEQSMMGVRFFMYFSGAYTGKKNKRLEDYRY